MPNWRYLSLISNLWVVGVLLLNSGLVYAQFTVVKLNLVSEQRVTRILYDYTYTVDITNTGTTVAEVSATIASTSSNTVILKNTLVFGEIAGGSSASSKDMFTLRHNRTIPFDPNVLVFVFSTKSTMPVANAGPDQVVIVGSTVNLDGSNSTDASSHSLNFNWSFVSIPEGSIARFSKSEIISPSFVADIAGEYVIQLIVDNSTRESVPDTVIITALNRVTPITNPSPESGSVLAADALPKIGALFSPEVNLDLTSARIFINGIDKTAQAQINVNGISYNSNTQFPEGSQEVIVRVSTLSGQESVLTWQFITRSLPDIPDVSPQDINTTLLRPLIRVRYLDIGAGIDQTKTRLKLNGTDVTSQARIDAEGVLFQPISDLSIGDQFLEVNATDLAGNSSTRSWKFIIVEEPQPPENSGTSGERGDLPMPTLRIML